MSDTWQPEEVGAAQEILQILVKLDDDDSRRRVMAYAQSRGIAPVADDASPEVA